jgi:hypothetical protein
VRIPEPSAFAWVKPGVTVRRRQPFDQRQRPNERGSSVSILWIILIIVLVLLLLGFFSRGRW